MSTDQIIEEALRLPPEEKARFAERLLESLSGQEQHEIDAEWAREAEKRIDAFEAGRTSARSHDDVFRELRARSRQMLDRER